MSYFIYLTLFGAAALSIGWIKFLSRKISVSYSIFYFLAGAVIYLAIPDLPWTHPFRDQTATKHITELMVIIALMGIGLKIDWPFWTRQWITPLLLASLAMILTIATIFSVGFFALGFPLATAVLLGAVLAPTDPVLASDVQVDKPGGEKDHKVKFALTGEAGLNDGLVFPFVWLAIALAGHAASGEPWLLNWLAYDVFFRIFAGIGVGFAAGKLITWLFFALPDRIDASGVQRGLVSLSATIFVYGLTELIHGYGFIAVFIAAVTIRNYEMDHDYHKSLHRFIDQIEHILLAVLLILFGGAVVDGLLESLTWTYAFWAMVFVLIVRPVAAWLSLLRVDMQAKDKAIVSFFGIKGIGSFFYLAFAVNEASFEQSSEIWSFTALVVLISLFIHGLTSAFAMKKLSE